MIRLVSWVLLTGPLAFAGCGDTTEPPAPRPAAVAVTPSTAEIPALGQTVQLTAEVRDQDGQPMPSAAVAWRSDAPAVATVDRGGLVTAVGGGRAKVTAASGSASGSAVVTVEQQVAAVRITPDTATLPAIEDTVRLAAGVLDANGHEITGVAVTWSSADTAVARVDGSGLVTAAGNGTATIAASAGPSTGRAAVTVAQVVGAVVVTPAANTVVETDTVRLSAVASDANGHEVTGAGIAWASRDTLVAVVDASGLVTGVGEGVVVVEARVSGVTGEAEIEVVRLVPTAVTVTPDSVVFAALGDSERLSAQVLDQVGRVMEGAVVAWTSGDTAVAVVDSAGVVTAVSEGTAAVTAAAGAASGTVAVTVAQVAGSVVVTPVADTVTLADTLRLAVKAFDANGHAVQRSAFLWSSSDPAVVTVDATGLVRGTAEGTATITAASGEASGTSEITVVSPDRAALVALYEATGGPKWEYSGNWMTYHPLRYWHGVAVNDEGRVTSLNLQNNLTGEIPPEIGNLTALQRLTLDNNDLTGPIPPELGNLSALESLSIQWSDLTGEIPPELGNLTALTGLHLHDNDLTGPIPAELGNLSALESLVLSQNNLTGEIPAELGNLFALRRLYLRLNDLTGPIPPELANLSNLGEYGLSLDVGPGELCVPDDARLRAWLLGRGASAFPCPDDPSIQLLPRALLREDGTGASLLLPDEFHSPSAVTVSDPSVVTASIRDGRWLELVPRGRGSAAVEVVPSGQGVPGVAEVVVRRAVGTFGIEFVMEQPAPIGAEEALTAAADWWSSVLDGTEWPTQELTVSCGSFALALGKPAGLFLDVEVGSGSGVSVKLHCFGRFSSSGTLRTGPSTCCGGPSQYDGARRAIGYFLGLPGRWTPFTEASELLSEDGAYFVGERAMAAFRAGGGDPSLPGVPLGYGRRFWHEDHVPCELMSESTGDCGRLTMDAISLAALADAGYRVDMSKATPWRKGK